MFYAFLGEIGQELSQCDMTESVQVSQQKVRRA
jgi:hypothetical protein